MSITFASVHRQRTAHQTNGKIIDAFASPLEKNLVLRDRERRWETLSPLAEVKFKVTGPAGVYELQEGIFLMCDEYSQADADDGRVGVHVVQKQEN